MDQPQNNGVNMEHDTHDAGTIDFVDKDNHQKKTGYSPEASLEPAVSSVMLT